MKINPSIKEVSFSQKPGKGPFFDFLPYSELMQIRPKDHSQFEHHRLHFYVLLVITEGHGQHSVQFEDYTLEKGTILSISKNSIHRFYPSQAKGYLLVFTEDFVLQFMSKHSAERIFRVFNELLTSPKTVFDRTDFEELKKTLHKIEGEFKDQDEYSPELIRNYLQIIITKLLRYKTNKESTLEDSKYLNQFLLFQQMVEKKQGEQNTVEFFAKELGVTTRTLNNICQAIVQKSAKKVIEEIRLKLVKRYLIHTELSISQIAARAGFFDTSQFSKFFKKHTGLAPKAFQAKFH